MEDGVEIDVFSEESQFYLGASNGRLLIRWRSEVNASNQLVYGLDTLDLHLELRSGSNVLWQQEFLVVIPHTLTANLYV